MYGIELVFYSSEGSTYRIQVQRIIDDGTGTQPAAGSPTTIAYLRPPNTTLKDVFEEASTGYWYRGRLVDDSHEAVGAWSEYVGVKPVNVTTDAPNNVGRVISPDQGGMLPVNAQGDMLFAIDSDAWTQLAIGATGEVLTVQSSGVPNWDAPGAPGGTLEVGVHDSVLGQLILRAPATGEAGGRIAIEVNPNHDTNVTFYFIDAFTDRLRFYADADVFAYYDDSADTFDFGCNVRVHGQTYQDLSAGSGSGGRDYLTLTIDSAETLATMILGKEGGGDAGWRLWRSGGSGTLFTIEPDGDVLCTADLVVNDLGRFDGSSTPDTDDILRYDGNEWVPVALQYRFTDGDVVSEVYTDDTAAAYVHDGRSLSGTPSAPNSAPAITAGYKSIVVDMSDLGGISGTEAWVIQWSTDSGSTWSDAADDEIVTTGDKVVHTKLLIDGTTYRYRVRRRGASDSSASPSTSDLAPLSEPDITPATVIVASQIATVDLSSISAAIGEITSGQIHNAADTAGVLISGSLPGTWTRYLNLAGSGVFLKHDKLELNYDGSATFTGTVETTSGGSGIKVYPGYAGIQFIDSSTTVFNVYGQKSGSIGQLKIDGISGEDNEIYVQDVAALYTIAQDLTIYTLGTFGIGRSSDGNFVLNIGSFASAPYGGDVTVNFYTESGSAKASITRLEGANAALEFVNTGTGGFVFTSDGDDVLEVTGDADFTGDVRARCLVADGDWSGDSTGLVVFTNVKFGVSTGTGTVKMNGATSRNSVGWVKLVIDGTICHVPYWTVIT
jgi:hypothetical protein